MSKQRRYWQQLLELKPTISELITVMRYCPDLRSSAWAEIMKLSPNHHDLRNVVQEVATYQEIAGGVLLKDHPSNDDLVFLLRIAPNLRCTAARELLNRPNLNTKELTKVIEYEPTLCDESWPRLKKVMSHRNDLLPLLELKTAPHHMLEVWNEWLTAKPTNDELIDVLLKAPHLRQACAEALFVRQPSPAHLITILQHVPLARDEAWKSLKATANDDELMAVVCRVESHREAAARLLLSRTHAAHVLNVIMTNVPALREEVLPSFLASSCPNNDFFAMMKLAPDLRDRIWVAYQKRKISNLDLGEIIREIPTLRQEAGDILLKQNPSRGELVLIIEYIQDLAPLAWQVLLAKGPANKNLVEIIRYVHDGNYRVEAWKRLITQEPSHEELRTVMDYTISLRLEASALYKQITQRRELIDAIRVA